MLFINPEEESPRPNKGTIQDAKILKQEEFADTEPLTQGSTKKIRNRGYIEGLREKIKKISKIIANKVTIKESEIPQSII